MLQKILVKGPALSRSGYGEQTRFALRALKSREDLFDIYVINTPWGGTGQIVENGEMQQWIHEVMAKTSHYVSQRGQFDLSLQVTIPPEFEKIAPINIGYTAGIETTKVAPQWIEKSNAVVDKIITVSQHSKTVFENTKYDATNKQTGEQVTGWGLQVPVEAVGYPVRLAEAEAVDINLTTSKNFLTISQWGPRKNLDNTIKWFVQEFADDEDAGLIIKANTASDSIIDRVQTVNRLEALLSTTGDRKCKVYLIHGELTEGQMGWLYQHPTIQALINIAHGEGYGLPLFEAAYNGLPVITITWGGQLDFLCRSNKKGKQVPHVIRVDYDISPVQKEAVWEGVIQKDSMWAYAKEASYKRALRKAIEKQKHYRSRAKLLQKTIHQNFSEDVMLEKFVACVHKEPDEEVVEWLKKIEEMESL
jgi:glycosyltransferase involved in cell wall biosynthesis